MAKFRKERVLWGIRFWGCSVDLGGPTGEDSDSSIEGRGGRMMEDDRCREEVIKLDS